LRLFSAWVRAKGIEMKCTQYFLYTRNRPDRRGIKEQWIQDAIDNPVRVEIQTDERIRKWTYIREVDRYLRVILLADGVTVHNAFFDRDFEG
jgi:hypothetical protein